ncbi:hypothetical protein [Corynebacterium otitidis]|nr:hypothetical protein [Corynebacterium otitidis]
MNNLADVPPVEKVDETPQVAVRVIEFLGDVDLSADPEDCI